MAVLFVIMSEGEKRRLFRLSELREIVPLMALAEASTQDGICRGIANLRGEMVPVFDLGGREAKLSPSRVILVTRMGSEIVGLLVDDVFDVVNVPDEDIAWKPVGVGRKAMMVRLGDEILNVMEPEDVLREAH